MMDWFDNLTTDQTDMGEMMDASQNDQADAERFRWLQERFAGYDFEWGEPAMVCAVFEVGQDFCGGRDISAAIDTAIALTKAGAA